MQSRYAISNILHAIIYMYVILVAIIVILIVFYLNTNNLSNINENFGLVVNKNDLNDEEIRSTIVRTDSSKHPAQIQLRQGYPKVNRDLEYVDHDDIVRYNGLSCQKPNVDLDVNLDLVKPIDRRVQLYNKPHVQLCKNKLNIAAVNSIRTQTMTAEGGLSDKVVNFYIPETYLGAAKKQTKMDVGLFDGKPQSIVMPNGSPDEYLSYNNISRDQGEPADVDQIGSIPVTNYEGEPVPIGSVFMD